MTPRFLYVTARDRRDLFESLRTEFDGQEDVQVILDRRRSERRRAILPPDPDRRRTDRRRRTDLQEELRAAGSFITGIDDAKPWP